MSAGYMKYLEELDPSSVKEIIDLKAQKMKNNVMFSENYKPGNERVIYVSNSGDDSNDGLSADTPIATLNKLNEIQKPYDTVLFKRGDHFRGRIDLVCDGVTYSAYGKGIKPILSGSRRDFADPDIWQNTEYENVYVCTETINNAGIIHFDPSYVYGTYDDKYGKMRLKAKDGFAGYADLCSDLEFYNDRQTNTLYLYSAEGNPGERFLSIEIGECGAIMYGNASDGTVDNLWITDTGSHGTCSHNVKNRTVTNCIFSWLGGSVLGGELKSDGVTPNHTRYGNAVQIYGGCDGFHVENNWMYQIYDTAITHQYGYYSVGDCIQDNVLYKDNISEFCFWHIEFYNGEREGTTRRVHNIYMTGNLCSYGGYGWGCKGRAERAPSFCGSHVCEDIENFVAEHNIFYHSLGYLVRLEDNPGARKIVVRNNVYVQQKGEKLGSIYGVVSLFDDTARQTLISSINEEDPTIVFMKKPNYNF